MEVYNNSMPGKLIIGGLDIGNYRDISPRMMDSIIKSDLILVESINIFQEKCKILNLVPSGSVIEYNYSNQSDQTIIDLVVEYFKTNKSVMIVSDDGMPGICDPGSLIIRTASLCNTPISSIPGPSIISTLPAMSGLNTKSFIFDETIPKDKNSRINRLKEARNSKKSFMFIVPDRINDSKLLIDILNDILFVYGDHAMMAIGIDLTMPTEFFAVNTVHNIIQKINNIQVAENTNISIFMNWVQ